MIKYAKTNEIPHRIRQGQTLKKDLLYNFGKLFTDEEIARLVDIKRKKKACQKASWDAMIDRVIEQNNFFAV